MIAMEMTTSHPDRRLGASANTAVLLRYGEAIDLDVRSKEMDRMIGANVRENGFVLTDGIGRQNGGLYRRVRYRTRTTKPKYPNFVLASPSRSRDIRSALPLSDRNDTSSPKKCRRRQYLR